MPSRRAAVADVAAHEFLRQGQSKQAAAQLIHNMRGHLQQALDLGSHEVVWKMTCVRGPAERIRSAGTPQDQAALAGYYTAEAALERAMRTRRGPPGDGDDGDFGEDNGGDGGQSKKERQAAAAKRKTEAAAANGAATDGTPQVGGKDGR